MRIGIIRRRRHTLERNAGTPPNDAVCAVAAGETRSPDRFFPTVVVPETASCCSCDSSIPSRSPMPSQVACDAANNASGVLVPAASPPMSGKIAPAPKQKRPLYRDSGGRR